MSTNIAVASPPEETTSVVTRNRIVCFVNDDLSAAALRKGLEGSNLEVRRGTIRNAIRMLETDTELFALVADIGEIDDPITELGRLSGVCPADVQVALIGQSTDIQFYRALMELGLSEYLPKPLTRDMVQNQLRPKLLGDVAPGPTDRGGHVISICGAQGGAGATSIAINLALQLAETTKAKVALLDLHLQGGETAVMLGVRPGPGLRIALENPMRADTLFLERAAIEINERVRLISADEELDAQLDITEAGVRHVLGLLRQRFNYIVVDVPVPLVPAIHPVITLSRHVLVLLEAEVTGVRNAHALRAAVTNIAGKGRVFTLLNRANRAGGLPTATIVQALGAKPDMVIPDLGKGMTQAVNLGIPALQHVSKLRRYLAPIVREIAAVGGEQKGMVQEVTRAMKTFGTRERDGTPTRLPALAPRRDEPATEQPVMPASLRERVIEQIEPAVAATVSREVLRRQIEEIIHGIANQERLELSGRDQFQLAEEIADDMTGYGPLRPLLLDESINDIMINGPSNVYVERKGKLERVAIRFRDNDHIASVAQKIAARVGRRVDESSPMVDCRLPDGSRVNIILPPLAIHSPCISIRKFPSRRYDMAGMIENGTMTAAMARLLEIAARSRLNVLVSGGTGSGKTTLLNALSQFIDHGERIVTIEDAAELQLQQPHVISLETRPPSLEGTGQVTQRDLVWNALRMRPDRIIVGEVRGPEAFDMLQAMNTGHDGSISTVHANTARDALTRIENMVQMGQANLPSRAIRYQIVAALDIIVQVERMRDGQRRIVQISEVIGLEGDVITTNDIVAFEYQQEDVHGQISGTYRSTQAIPKFKSRLAYYGLDRAWAEAMRQL